MPAPPASFCTVLPYGQISLVSGCWQRWQVPPAIATGTKLPLCLASNSICMMLSGGAFQVDGFSARIKPEPKDVEEEEEEGIGDVDLFALDKDNEVLTVNAKWLHHLQVCNH